MSYTSSAMVSPGLLGAYLDARPALDALNDGGEVLISPEFASRKLKHLTDRVADPHRYRHCFRLLHTQPQVLVHQAVAEAVVEGPGQDGAGEFVADRSIESAAGFDDFYHNVRIEPRFNPHDHRFRTRGHSGRGQHVIGELHRLAHTGLFADKEHLADDRQHRLQ